jgi:hypothetical protein
MDDKQAQPDKFNDAARAPGRDAEEARWDKRLRKVSRPQAEKAE